MQLGASLFAIAATGLNAAEARLGVAAQNTAAGFAPQAAQGGAPSPPAPGLQLAQFPLPGGGVGTSVQAGAPDDPVADVVNEMEAAQAFKANLRILQVGEETQQSLLDLKA